MRRLSQFALLLFAMSSQALAQPATPPTSEHSVADVVPNSTAAVAIGKPRIVQLLGKEKVDELLKTSALASGLNGNEWSVYFDFKVLPPQKVIVDGVERPLVWIGNPGNGLPVVIISRRTGEIIRVDYPEFK